MDVRLAWLLAEQRAHAPSVSPTGLPLPTAGLARSYGYYEYSHVPLRVRHAAGSAALCTRCTVQCSHHCDAVLLRCRAVHCVVLSLEHVASAARSAPRGLVTRAHARARRRMARHQVHAFPMRAEWQHSARGTQRGAAAHRPPSATLDRDVTSGTHAHAGAGAGGATAAATGGARTYRFSADPALRLDARASGSLRCPSSGPAPRAAAVFAVRSTNVFSVDARADFLAARSAPAGPAVLSPKRVTVPSESEFESAKVEQAAAATAASPRLLVRCGVRNWDPSC